MIKILSYNDLKEILKVDDLTQFTEEVLINNIKAIIPKAKDITIHEYEHKSKYMAMVII